MSAQKNEKKKEFWGDDSSWLLAGAAFGTLVLMVMYFFVVAPLQVELKVARELWEIYEDIGIYYMKLYSKEKQDVDCIKYEEVRKEEYGDMYWTRCTEYSDEQLAPAKQERECVEWENKIELFDIQLVRCENGEVKWIEQLQRPTDVNVFWTCNFDSTVREFCKSNPNSKTFCNNLEEIKVCTRHEGENCNG